ncbi:MAG TPA: hypothetical protein VM487_16700 [Phycisphaerae bacterium]|nr:hypothetical protein [Phycisphaerae bacterium]
MTSEAAERTDAQVAAAIRECLHGLNRLLSEAAGRGMEVDVFFHDMRSIGCPAGLKIAEAKIQKVADL